MFEKILVCLDGSEFAEQILSFVTEEALHFRSKIILLHVVAEPVVIAPGIPGASAIPVETKGMLEHMKKEQDEAAVYLGKIAEGLRQKGLETEPVVVTGPTGDTIINYANDNDVGLIAIATHGRSGLGRAVFGSVADYVLRESGLPVLLIRPRIAQS
jgi:nucleotide-binding universal stress UspA family protein